MRRAAIWGLGEIELDEPVVLVPNFRKFTPNYGGGSKASLIVLSKKPTEVLIKTAKLIDPNSSLEKSLTINNVLQVDNLRQRLTSFSERRATGGVFKGKRSNPTDLYKGVQTLFGQMPQFNELKSLRLEVVVSIDQGPEELITLILDIGSELILILFINYL